MGLPPKFGLPWPFDARYDFAWRPILLCGGNFVDDGLRGGTRIGSGQNWPPYHEKIRRGANWLAGVGLSRLIVGSGLQVGNLPNEAWSDDQKAIAARFP